MDNPFDESPPKVKRAETIDLKKIEGVPHFIVATDEEDHYIERVALVLLDDDENSEKEKIIPGDDINPDRILLIDPISTNETTVYQYPQQMLEAENSAALVLIFLKNHAAIAIVPSGARMRSEQQDIEIPKELVDSAFDNRYKQLVIEWLQRAEYVGEYLSAILK